MLHINDLPTLVLHQILKTLIGKSIFAESDFKRGCIYLQVCHLWRHIGCPLVYQTIFFRYSSSHTLLHSGSPWVNNVNLVKAGDCNSYVRRLTYICYDYIANQPISMEPLLGIFNMGPTNLPPKVESLLNLSSIRGESYKSSSMLIRQQTSSCIKSIVDKFARTFPNVSRIQLITTVNGQPLDMLFSELINVYSRQLNNLDVYSDVRQAVKYPLPQLKCLALNTSDPVSSVNIDPESLTELVLIFTLDRFPWGHFATSSENSKLVFSSLKRLELQIRLKGITKERLPETSDSRTIALYFPSLEFLKVYNENENMVQSLPRIVLPVHIPVLQIKYSAAAIQQTIQLGVRSVGHLYVFIQRSLVGRNLDQFYTNSNYIFSSWSITEWSSLECFRGSYELDVYHIQWKNLSSLSLEFLDDESIMELLSKMPNLRNLKIEVVDSADLKWEYPNIYSADDGHGIMEWCSDSRLAEISIVEFSEIWAVKDAANFMLALLFAHRRLKRITIQDELTEELSKNIARAMAEYPHLDEISINFQS